MPLTPDQKKLLQRCLPFLLWAPQVSRSSLQADFFAGLSGAIIALPQGVAYALIAGLPPEYGLYTAIITPIVAGLFGSSMHLISGPAAAISIVVMSVVSNAVEPGSSAFIPAVLTLTLLVGIIQLGLGLARLGTLVNFISHTVVISFTAGAAILIATSQIKYAIGVTVSSGASFLESWIAVINQLGQANPYAIATTLVTVVSALLLKRINPRLPVILIAMLMGSVACWLMSGAAHGVALVGALPGHLPGFILPDLSYGTISNLLPGAISVAILGLVEAVSIARAIAIRSGQRIEGNQEFVGQGLSNIVGSFFSCYAGSGSFTRSGINYESGAQTPMAGIFAALMLILILLFAPEITALLPLPAMAGAIFIIAWGLIDTHHIKQILRSNKQEASVLLVTFAATLIIKLEFAIYLGVMLSLVMYLRRTSQPRIMTVAPKGFEHGTELRSIERFALKQCPQLKILRIDGSIFFGAVDHVQKTLQLFNASQESGQHLLIICSGINFIDVSGAEMLKQEVNNIMSKGNRLSFCALKNTVWDELNQAGYIDQIGTECFYSTIDEALLSLTVQMNAQVCINCSHRVFKQCPKQLSTQRPK
ncbi:SulP family inorganic anion transporter [Neptunomonas antarctica]|uniref:Sulfate permease, SulP family n=1 Tax=Neptunomonas antarctica TaxID=619304 RepID=A0A1N7IXQ6_9GAMM|nr:SulP family inorganic anion transporter [Neptunomonas antarctica]SIS41834.1 sulfate permease, SulP family [Neptunomonas antarctica]